jgi:S-DNA-T family DNA segregation ATPase FtsK/SpoIIIE
MFSRLFRRRPRRGPITASTVDKLRLSIFDPIHIGVDEFGALVWLALMFRNILIGGEPGAGKSSLLNLLVAHAALSMDCTLCLLDGKQVELGLWERCADVFVGPDITLAIGTLQRLQTVMDNRYRFLKNNEQRKIAPGGGIGAILLAVDEIAYFSATVGDRKTQDQFSALLRDLVARGRAVGIMVAAATQRPSSDIIPTSLRDQFAWRFAGRCTTDVSSDIVLGHGWTNRGFTAKRHLPDQSGRWAAHRRRWRTAAGEGRLSVRRRHSRDCRPRGPAAGRPLRTARGGDQPRRRCDLIPCTAAQQSHGCGTDQALRKQTGPAAAHHQLEGRWRHERYPSARPDHQRHPDRSVRRPSAVGVRHAYRPRTVPTDCGRISCGGLVPSLASTGR